MMKKAISIICVLAMLLVVFTGCSKNESTSGVNLKNVLHEINAQFDINECIEITDVSDMELYYTISPDDIVQFAAEYVLNTSTEPIEIVMVEAVDKEAKDRIELALINRFNSQSAQSQSYSAEAHLVFEKCGVETNGNFVTMIVSDEVEGIKALYNSYFE